jgi:hypothetical protein
MGKPVAGGEGRIFFGESVGDADDPATLGEALASAAEKVVREGIVTPDQTMVFDIVRLRVEIGNQHVKTFTVGITGQGGGA